MKTFTKQGLCGRGTRPMTGYWSQDDDGRLLIPDQTMTVGIDRLSVKLRLDRRTDETSKKAFETWRGFSRRRSRV